MERPKIRFRTKPQAYGLAEKTAVLAFMEAERVKGTPMSEIVKNSGVSQATIYRWLRATDTGTLRWRSVCENKLNIAIERLSNPAFEDRWSLLEAIFTFSSWLHWPSNVEFIPMGATSMLSLYALKTEGKAFVSELTDLAQQAICRNMLLHDFANIGLPEYMFPIFRNEELDDQPFTMRELIGEGTGCLFAMALDGNPRFAPSLSKINYLMRSRLFRYTWQVGRVTLEKAWSENLPAAPFYYVDTFHSDGLDWVLYPDSHLFVGNTDELAANVARYPTYFRRCKAASSTLAAILPERRRVTRNYPKFPGALSKEQTSPPPLTDTIKTALKSYKSSDKYLNLRGSLPV